MNKQRREFIYSILIIIAIPLLVVANTIFIIRGVRAAYNLELQRKANTVNTVIAETLRSDIVAGNTASLQAKLTQLKESRPELVQLYIVAIADGESKVIAKTDDVTEKQLLSSSLQQKIAVDKKNAIARLVAINRPDGNGQAWAITSPLIDTNSGKVIALVASSVATTDAEEAIATALQTSAIALAATIVVIVLLLLRHMRLLSYAKLLAKEREVNQTMSDFLSVATHELKAPMSIIKGYISNVVEDTQPPLNDAAKEQLGVALAQTDRLNGLVQDLLNVSRIDQGRIEYNLQPVVLDEVLSPIIKNYTMMAEEKNMSIAYTADSTLVAYADAGRTQEIFTNLIDNAVKYSKQGTVTVSVKAQGNKLVASVRDTGIGMDEEHRKRLFQRFYRIKNDDTKDISGTGLGLWIIKQYIEAMGGTITVESMVGAGSEFIVTLPAYGKQPTGTPGV